MVAEPVWPDKMLFVLSNGAIGVMGSSSYYPPKDLPMQFNMNEEVVCGLLTHQDGSVTEIRGVISDSDVTLWGGKVKGAPARQWFQRAYVCNTIPIPDMPELPKTMSCWESDLLERHPRKLDLAFLGQEALEW